jgi:hypothetical protein
MSERIFRYLAGLLMLAVHFGNIGMLTITPRFGADHVPEHVAAVLILAPLTLVYLVPFIRMVVVDTGNHPDTPWIPFLATLTMMIVIVLFCIGLTWVVYTFSYNHGFDTNDEFKMWLGVVETGFGGLVGTIFERLFAAKIGNPLVGA